MFNNSEHYQSATNDDLNTVKRNPKIKLSQFREHLAKLLGFPSHNAVKQHIDKINQTNTPTVPLTPYEMFSKGWPFIINDQGWGYFYSGGTTALNPCDEIHYTNAEHGEFQLEFNNMQYAPVKVHLERDNAYIIVDDRGEQHFVRFFAPVEFKAPKKLSNTFNPMSLSNPTTYK